MSFRLVCSFKEGSILALLLFLVFLTNVFLSYLEFKEFKLSKHPFLKGALIKQSYIKSKADKKYRVLYLKYKDLNIYTSQKATSTFKSMQLVDLRLMNYRVGFKDYLSKRFYASSYDIKVVAKQSLGFRSYFLDQHKDPMMRQLYGALFFALPLSKDLRTAINNFGVSHLVAISGYHLGLIFTILYFAFSLLYRVFHGRYFPWRDEKLDLSLLIFCVLFGYAYILGFVPSFVRSLIMAIFAFFLLWRNIKIFSFTNLLLCTCFAIALYPSLLFSLGFFFSILGVFYIFLFLHHFGFKAWYKLLWLNLFVFSTMIIPVHHFYPQLSFYQLLALPLNLVFGVYYPLALFAHIIGYGSFLDPYLEYVLSLSLEKSELFTPTWLFYLYLFLSILAIFYKRLSYFLPCLGLLYFIYLF